MGNSKSQFKRSRSEYGSTRSVAFSLPSTWDRRSYAYGEPIYKTPSIASSQSVASHPKPILRNSSRTSSTGSVYGNGFSSNNGNIMSRSLSSLQSSSLYDTNPASYHRSQSADRQLADRKSSAYSKSQSDLSQHQFNDIYLKNDLKKLFKAQDRSNSVAKVGEDPADLCNSTASLDRRLVALKSQRTRSQQNSSNKNGADEPRREGATEKRIRSKKSKKAPLPQSTPRVVLPPTMEGKYRKKRPAPAPPTPTRSQSLPSLLPETVADIPTSPTASLLEEIDRELVRNKIPVVHTEPIPIPKPDYEMSQRYPAAVPKSVVTKKSKKPVPPPKPVFVDLASLKARKPSTTSTGVSTSAITGDSLAITTKTSPTSSPSIHEQVAVPVSQSTTTAQSVSSAPTKKEVREIATQYDAPVEIAIQCDGNTLRLKSSTTSVDTNAHQDSSTSLADLFQLFTQAAKAAESANEPSQNKPDDSQSECSDTSSGRSRNSAQQKIVRMNEVLAGVPTPPPLPDSGVILVQRRTIKENVPISLAPSSPATNTDDTSSQESGSPPRNFNSFQQELLCAYDKLNSRKQNSSSESSSLEERRDSDSSSTEASALKVFKHAETIMGISAPPGRADTESDSGNDEPSDYGSSLSQSQDSKSLPDFVLDDIARSLPAESDIVPVKLPLYTDKSKFNSIKKIKQSMRNALNSISRGSTKHEMTLPSRIPTDDVGFGSENWTFSGRIKTRQSVLSTDTFSMGQNKETSTSFSRRSSLPKDISSTADTTGEFVTR